MLLSTLVLPLMPLLVRMVNRIVMPRRIRRFYAQQTMLRMPGTSSWDEEGMRWEGEAMTSAMKWPAFHGWVADENVTILLHTDMLFNLIPHRALSPQQRADLKATLVAHGPGKR